MLAEWVRLHQQMAQMLRSSESIHIWWYFVTFFTFSLKLAKHYHQAVLPNVYFLLMQHVCLSLLSNYQNLFRYQKKIICLVWHFSRARWQLLLKKTLIQLLPSWQRTNNLSKYGRKIGKINYRHCLDLAFDKYWHLVSEWNCFFWHWARMKLAFW